jgi:hypothetical protein
MGFKRVSSRQYNGTWLGSRSVFCSTIPAGEGKLKAKGATVSSESPPKVRKESPPMETTAWEMVKIIRDSTNDRRMEDAANTLMGILPTLDKSSVDEVIWEMTKILRDSNNEDRRSIAQRVLILFQNARSLR